MRRQHREDPGNLGSIAGSRAEKKKKQARWQPVRFLFGAFGGGGRDVCAGRVSLSAAFDRRRAKGAAYMDTMLALPAVKNGPRRAFA